MRWVSVVAALASVVLTGQAARSSGSATGRAKSMTAGPGINAIHMVTPTFGVAVRDSPFALLDTTTGAKTWRVVAEPSPAIRFVAWGFGPGGLAWVQASSPSGVDNPDVVLPGSRLWTWTPGATTWTTRSLDPNAGTVFQFLTSRVAMAWRVFGRGAGTSRTALYRSVDAGAAWRKVSISGGGDPTGITFASARQGWMTGFVATGGDWDVQATADGGTSWQPVALAKPPNLASQEGTSFPPVFCSSTVGYMAVLVTSPPDLNNDMVVYETADSGSTWSPAVALPYGPIACGTGGTLYVSAPKRVFVVRGASYRHVRLARTVSQVSDFLSADVWYGRGAYEGNSAPGWYVTKNAGKTWSPLPIVVRSR